MENYGHYDSAFERVKVAFVGIFERDARLALRPPSASTREWLWISGLDSRAETRDLPGAAIRS